MITLSGVTVGTCTGSQESPPFFETCMTRVLLFWKKKKNKKKIKICVFRMWTIKKDESNCTQQLLVKIKKQG